MTLPSPFPWRPFLGAAVLAALLSFLLARLLGPRGWLDVPTGRRQHAKPTPRTAGLALLIGLGIMALAGYRGLALQPVQVIGVVALGLLGAFDDRIGMGAAPKALASFLVAVLLAGEMALRLRAHAGPIPLAGLPVPNQLWATFPLLILWFWSIPQALNLADGIDGFALGLSGLAIAAAGVSLGLAPGFWGLFAAILLLNYPKAFHFLGDCGSLALGGLVAIKVMEVSVAKDASLALWICAYLVVDVSAVTLGRWRAGLPLGLGDRGHLHHLVTDLLGSPRLATPVLLAVAGAPMLRAVDSELHATPAVMGLAVLLVLGIVAVLRYRRMGIHPGQRHQPGVEGVEHGLPEA